MDPTHSREKPSCSAIDLDEIKSGSLSYPWQLEKDLLLTDRKLWIDPMDTKEITFKSDFGGKMYIYYITEDDKM
jgi:hypothetical protein